MYISSALSATSRRLCILSAFQTHFAFCTEHAFLRISGHSSICTHVHFKRIDAHQGCKSHIRSTMLCLFWA